MQQQQRPQSSTLHKVGQTNEQSHRSPAKETLCYRWGGNNHGPLDCRFKDAECHSCRKKGHLAQVCCKSTHGRTPQNQSKRLNQQQQSRTTHQVEAKEEVSDSSDCNNLFTLQVGAQTKPLTVTVKVNNCDLEMEVDTGASLSIISEATY